MATATKTKAPTDQPSPAPAGPAEDPDGPLLRALFATAPEAGAGLEKLAATQRSQLGYAAGAVHPHGLAAQIANVREKAIPLRKTLARLDYLARLKAGPDVAGPFVAPDDDPEADAVETLRGLLARSQHGHEFGRLVGLIDSRLAEWKATIDKKSPLCDAASWPEMLAAADPAATLDHLRATILGTAELSGRVAGLDAARGRLVDAFRSRVAAAVKSAGGAAAVVEAIREAARLGDGLVAAAGAELLAGLNEELAGVDARLAKLNIDPASATAAGRAGQALLDRRAGLVSRIADATGAAASQEAAGHGSLVDQALAFSPSAWAKILASCRAEPSAFPPGFEAAWSSIPLDSLIEAGASAFVEPFAGP